VPFLFCCTLPDVARSAVFRDGEIVVTMESGGQIRFALAENRCLAPVLTKPELTIDPVLIARAFISARLTIVATSLSPIAVRMAIRALRSSSRSAGARDY
jgi:hypothetical protein